MGHLFVNLLEVLEEERTDKCTLSTELLEKRPIFDIALSTDEAE
jgi:hypothetical protein